MDKGGRPVFCRKASTIQESASPNTKCIIIRRSCYELQSNLRMINHCVAFHHTIPNKNLMSIVNMNYMYVYGSYRNPVLVFMTI
jgi:hypothetical protein